jgi:hypothetical protein
MTPITQMTFLPLCSWYSPDSWFPKKRTDHQCVAAASVRQEAKGRRTAPLAQNLSCQTRRRRVTIQCESVSYGRSLLDNSARHPRRIPPTSLWSANPLQTGNRPILGTNRHKQKRECAPLHGVHSRSCALPPGTGAFFGLACAIPRMTALRPKKGPVPLPR